MSQEPATTPRRSFLGLMGALLAVPAFSFAGVLTFLRSMWPNLLYEPPKKFKIGDYRRFGAGVTMVADKRLFVVNENNKLHVISAVCEHLGCTVAKVDVQKSEQTFTDSKSKEVKYEETYQFHCACHGSKYHQDGTRFAGPAPRALKWFLLDKSPDGELVVDSATDEKHDYRYEPGKSA